VTAARCQLYLAAPAELPEDFAAALAAVLDAAEIACLRLPARPGIGDLIRLAQGRGTAVVIAGNPALADELGADGVHLVGLEAYGAARGRLGPDAIIGVHCDRSRHDAMEAGEAGADYVSFAADLELVRWWAELMLVPVVAELDHLDQAADFAAAGAEFILLGDALWNDPGGAPAAIRQVESLLRQPEQSS
jgi:thiamine-phosphate pyrophosphorylase